MISWPPSGFPRKRCAPTAGTDRVIFDGFVKSGSCKRNDGRRCGGEGAAIHALRLAEIYVVDGESSTTVERIIRSRGVKTHDVSKAAADVCTKADLRYLKRRMSRSDPTVPALPLPGIFTDAHAKMMGGARHCGSRPVTYLPPFGFS
jgi:hypothetical protein